MPRFLSPIYVKQEIVTGNETISGNETILGVTSGRTSYWTTVNSELSVSSELGYFNTLSSNNFNTENIGTYLLNSTNLSSSYIDSIIVNALTGFYQTLTASNVICDYIIGDGSRLTGILASGGYSTDIFKLPLSGGVLTGGLTGTNATFNTISSAVISGTYYGDGSNLTGVIANGGYGTDISKLPLSGGVLTGGLTGTEAKFNSINTDSITGTHYGDGSNLTGVIANGGIATDPTKLPLSGGIVTGDLTILGGITALSGSTFVNTIFTTTSALSIVNTGLGPALYVLQGSGAGDIASFYDGDGVEVLHVGNALNPVSDGVIGIKTSSPNKTLTVIGDISATSSIWGNNFYGNADNLSSVKWDSVYTTVNSNSSTWSLVTTLSNTTTELSNLTSKFDNTYNTVNSNSAQWSVTTDNTKLPLSGGTITGSLSVNGTISTIEAISASAFYGDGSKLTGISLGGAVDTTKLPLTGGTITGNLTVTGTFSTINTNNWQNTYTTVSENSAKWESVYSTTNNLSSNWNSTVNTVSSLSSNWQSVYSSVNSTSSNWQNTYTTVSSNSAKWESAYTTLSSNSASYVTLTGTQTLTNKTVIDWMTLVRGYNTTPTLLTSLVNGDVYSYIYNSSPSNITYYRFIATDGSEDKFYSYFSGNTLSGLVASKSIFI